MMKYILTKLRELTKKQKIIIASCTAVALIAVSGGIVFAHYQAQKRQAALEAQKTEEPPVIEIEEQEEQVVEEVVPELKNISFTGTSIAKDLKIKIIDEQKKLVSGSSFVITVTLKGSSSGKDYNDHDKDGIIYIKNIEAGEYTVQLHDIEGFAIATNSISVTVKEKIEYKKVDVQNEIKQASEVNIQKEDKPVEKPKEETKIVNTVELLSSTKKENPIKKENVDTTNFSKATVSEEKNTFIIQNTTTVTVPESVILYAQNNEQSKSCIVSYEVADEQKIIREISWHAEQEGVFIVTPSSDASIVVTAAQKGTANLCAVVTYEEHATNEEDSITDENNSEQQVNIVTEEGATDEGGNTELKQQTISIPVTVSDFIDDKTQLKDKEGNDLYLDKDGKQPATLKDYASAEGFYSEPNYTGWQSIDGKLYYYNENHKAVTGVQIIGGVRYNFGEDGAMLKTEEQRGIDVSKWNGKIDWNAVANAGIDFAIIRAGNRGSTAGVLIEDPYFKTNIKGATSAGIKVGVYIYSQAITEAEAIEEASMALTLVKGYRLHLPIYFDTEFISGGRANSLSASARTAIAKAFCETIRNAGYMPGIYSNYYWLRDNLKMSQLDIYSVWVARYNDKCEYPGKYDMWQYTSTGRVPGINGDVDLNISYVGY